MWPPSHGAEETKPAIYGPCGVMACTLGIYYYLKLIFKVAVRICAGPSFSFAGFFFFVHVRVTTASPGLQCIAGFDMEDKWWKPGNIGGIARTRSPIPE
jgi:hypothetical protein